ncbi:hypothetical protein MesoLjLc_68370 [Mesorhizobium sp. L-8-10]|nr:hypothetical protein MesoLjLc_68370 [Mesorhizobium sp. L-8-10]
MTMVWEHPEAPGMFDVIAHNGGKIFVCPEFGGGMVNPKDLDIYEAGVRNALIHLELIGGESEYPLYHEKRSGRLLETRRSSDELSSPVAGIFEPRCSVLDEVEAGDVVGRIYPLGDGASAMIEIRAPNKATVYAVRSSAYVDAQEQVVLFARDMTDHSLESLRLSVIPSA